MAESQLLWASEVRDACARYDREKNEIKQSAVFRETDQLVRSQSLKGVKGKLERLRTDQGGDEVFLTVSVGDFRFTTPAVSGGHSRGSSVYQQASELSEGECVVVSAEDLHPASMLERSMVCDLEYFATFLEVARCPRSVAPSRKEPPVRAVKPTPREGPERVYVTALRLNARSGPTANDAVLAKLAFGTACEVAERQETWAKVKCEQQAGWVSAEFLASQPPDPEALKKTVGDTAVEAKERLESALKLLVLQGAAPDKDLVRSAADLFLDKELAIALEAEKKRTYKPCRDDEDAEACVRRVAAVSRNSAVSLQGSAFLITSSSSEAELSLTRGLIEERGVALAGRASYSATPELKLVFGQLASRSSSQATSKRALPGTGIIEGYEFADSGCGVEIRPVHGTRSTFATISCGLADEKWIGKAVRLGYGKGEIFASSCQGSVDCEDFETVDMILSVTPLPVNANEPKRESDEVRKVAQPVWSFLNSNGCLAPEEVIGRAVGPADLVREGCSIGKQTADKVLLDCSRVPGLGQLFVMQRKGCDGQPAPKRDDESGTRAQAATAAQATHSRRSTGEQGCYQTVEECVRECLEKYSYQMCYESCPGLTCGARQGKLASACCERASGVWTGNADCLLPWSEVEKYKECAAGTVFADRYRTP